MQRRRRATATSAGLVILVLLAGCARSQEASVLEEFFHASRLRDNVTLGSFATTTAFDPRTDGIVQSFDVTSIGEDRRTPILPEHWNVPIRSAHLPSLVELSLAHTRPPVDEATPVNGEVVSRDVVIDAQVRLPGGGIEARTLKATLARVRVIDGDGNALDGRWIVTGVARQEGPQGS